MTAGVAERWVDRRAMVAALVGALPVVVFYLLERPENVFYQPLSPTGWALAAAGLAVPPLLGRPEWFRSAVAMAAGAGVATAVFVFLTGPGNLWPIAIALGTLAAAIPLAAGSTVGAVVMALMRRLAPRGV